MATIVGYVDKSIFVQVDGGEAVVGTVTAPVTFTSPDPDVVGIAVQAGTGPAEVTIDDPEHAGCPADITLAAYVKTGDDHTSIGSFTCCTGCQPAPYDGD